MMSENLATYSHLSLSSFQHVKGSELGKEIEYGCHSLKNAHPYNDTDVQAAGGAFLMSAL